MSLLVTGMGSSSLLPVKLGLSGPPLLPHSCVCLSIVSDNGHNWVNEVVWVVMVVEVAAATTFCSAPVDNGKLSNDKLLFFSIVSLLVDWVGFDYKSVYTWKLNEWITDQVEINNGVRSQTIMAFSISKKW